MNSLWESVDIYCERTAAGLLNEPLNALSNLSFFIAAWLLWRLYKKQSPDPSIRNLILGIAIVGAGSMLFHTFATRIAMLADVIPIMVLVLYYLWVSLRRLMGWTRGKTALALLIFFLVLLASYAIPAPYNVNGSASYFPCLIVIGLMAWRVRSPLLLRAFCWLTLSLIFRSVDMAVCESFPEGTHFLWHSLNGVVLYLLVKAVMKPVN
jgi:hypothetical protein